MSTFMPLGAMFEPIGYCQDGSPIWLFQGGSPEGEGDGGNGGGNDGGSGGSGDSGNQGDGGKSGEGEGEGGSDPDDDDDDDDSEATEGLPDNVKAILKKNRKAARDAQKATNAALAAQAAAEAKVQAFEDKDKTELQRAQDEAAREKQRAETLAAQLKTSALETAFLQDSTHTWVDAEDALDLAMRRFGLADLEVVDGKVDRKAVKAIAKKLGEDKKHLVAGEEKPKGGKSGGSFNNGEGKPSGGASETALVNRYPALRGRNKTG